MILPTNFSANFGNFSNYKAAANSVIGGNIVTIALRQALRLKSKIAADKFKAQQQAAIGRAIAAAYRVNPLIDYIGIPISVKTQETYIFESEVAQHAIEEGSFFADHIILKPIKIDVEFSISNWDGISDPSSSLFILEQAWSQRMPLQLTTAHKIIDNVVLAYFEPTNRLPNWGSLTIKASFIQIKQVQLQSIKYPAKKVTASPNPNDPQPGGGAVPKSVETNKDYGAVNLKSTLVNIFDAIGQ